MSGQGLWLARLAVLLLALHLVSKIVYNIFFHPLAKYPGPKSWSISRLAYFKGHITGTIQSDTLRLHEEYNSPIVRVGPNELSYTTEQVWTDAWAHRQGHQEFSKFYLDNPPSVNGTYGILGAGKADHARFRRLFSHAFSEKGLREQEPRIMSYVNLLVQRLKENASSGPQDAVTWYNWITFDIIGDLAWGESFKCLESSSAHPWIEMVQGNITAVTNTRPLIYYNLAWLIPYTIPKKVMAARMKNLSFAADQMTRRISQGTERGDFFDRILIKSEKSENEGMSELEMASNASHIILAGSETTATLLSGATFLLTTHPDILVKATAEVRSTFATEEEITILAVARLTYLIAVLQETMRLYPPVPILAKRIVPEGGDTVDGHFLPAGTIIHMNPYAAFRSKSNFVRPDEFLPERWLSSKHDLADNNTNNHDDDKMDGGGRTNESDNEFKHDNHAIFHPFAVGPRNCIGKNLAYAEMRLILAKILWHFDIRLAGSSDCDDDTRNVGGRDSGVSRERERAKTSNQTRWMHDQKTSGLWCKPPLWIDFKPRVHS